MQHFQAMLLIFLPRCPRWFWPRFLLVIPLQPIQTKMTYICGKVGPFKNVTILAMNSVYSTYLHLHCDAF